MATKALNDRHSEKKNDRNQQVPETTGLIYTQIWVLAQILSTQTLTRLPQVNKRYNRYYSISAAMYLSTAQLDRLPNQPPCCGRPFARDTRATPRQFR